MKSKMINGKRYLSRGRHRKYALANQNAERLRKGGRLVRIIEKDGMFHVWATSIFD